uniref:Uncharacterized protein n=1 Tax=Anopheles melas TaxID=34690 RepID=A0A182U5W1_9DIPT
MDCTVAATTACTAAPPPAAPSAGGSALASLLCPCCWCFGVAALLSVVLSAEIFGDVMTAEASWIFLLLSVLIGSRLIISLHTPSSCANSGRIRSSWQHSTNRLYQDREFSITSFASSNVRQNSSVTWPSYAARSSPTKRSIFFTGVSGAAISPCSFGSSSALSRSFEAHRMCSPYLAQQRPTSAIR